MNLCVCVYKVCLGMKVTLTVSSDNGGFSLPFFLPPLSHTLAEYMKRVFVECYCHQLQRALRAGFVPRCPGKVACHL